MYEVFGRRLDSRKLSTPFNELARAVHSLTGPRVSIDGQDTQAITTCGRRLRQLLGVSACIDLFFLRLHRRPTISDIRNRPEMQKARTCVAIGM